MTSNLFINIGAGFLVLLLGQFCFAQREFSLPRKLDVTPATYLEELWVGDSGRQLNKGQRQQLCKLFADSYLLSKRKYKQDYLIDAQAPVYKLFKRNFPGIAAKEGEGGVFMGDILEFAKKQPDCSTINQASSTRKRR